MGMQTPSDLSACRRMIPLCLGQPYSRRSKKEARGSTIPIKAKDSEGQGGKIKLVDIKAYNRAQQYTEQRAAERTSHQHANQRHYLTCPSLLKLSNHQTRTSRHLTSALNGKWRI
ncbi:hypothetical protein PTTW11_11412, partial [Pyrenophora teres f. teres]